MPSSSSIAIAIAIAIAPIILALHPPAAPSSSSSRSQSACGSAKANEPFLFFQKVFCSSWRARAQHNTHNTRTQPSPPPPSQRCTARNAAPPLPILSTPLPMRLAPTPSCAAESRFSLDPTRSHLNTHCALLCIALNPPLSPSPSRPPQQPTDSDIQSHQENVGPLCLLTIREGLGSFSGDWGLRAIGGGGC